MQLQLIQYDLNNMQNQQQSMECFSVKLVKNICKSIQMFSTKCEQMLNIEQNKSLTTTSSNTTTTTNQLINLDQINSFELNKYNF